MYLFEKDVEEKVQYTIKIFLIDCFPLQKWFLLLKNQYKIEVTQHILNLTWFRGSYHLLNMNFTVGGLSVMYEMFKIQMSGQT